MVGKSLHAVVNGPRDKEAVAVMGMACSCLEGVREGLAEMGQHRGPPAGSLPPSANVRIGRQVDDPQS